MAGLIETMIRNAIKSESDTIIKSTPDMSIFWAGSRDNKPVNTYGIFIGTYLICYGRKGAPRPYEVHIPPRKEVNTLGQVLIDILRAVGMNAELFVGDTIILEGMEVPWDAEKMHLGCGTDVFIIK
jgi:hypothetical protein